MRDTTLSPTGKAADRIREKTGKDASTIHSFLAKRGWLNPNLTLRQTGGQREDKVTTFVIDEASMLDLEWAAALFRAINWSAVQRVIIVGDPNQLPPIGRGKVFADMEEDTGTKRDEELPHTLWITAARGKAKYPRPDYHQIISPYRNEEFGTEAINLRVQKEALLSPELLYTGLTRASRHCTLLVEEDIAPLLKIRRPESSHLVGINCSLFDFTPAPDGFKLLRRPHEGYLEDRKIHRALADVMVRSKSEVIIANMLFDRDIAFEYEKPLYAPDGSFYLPDFTILWRGERYFWEHLGMLERDEYRRKWETKRDWYEKHFPGRLVTTEESGDLSMQAKSLFDSRLS